ncbi:MAG: hypothetical protein ACKVX7_17455 [Planctomycetota bacterium]
MARFRLAFAALAFISLTGATTAFSQNFQRLHQTNATGMRPLVSTGNVLTVGAGGSGPFGPGAGAILYCPSEADDVAYRDAISMAAGGVTVDYFDTRVATPDIGVLAGYSAVYTWANFAYFDNVGFGDVLATYADGGGQVILGAFCTFTQGNSLSGLIMTDAYCPVVSPAGNNHFSMSPYALDGASCIHAAPWSITNYDCTYRDFLVLQGAGVQDGSYMDGEIAHAFRPDFAVVYSNGAGAFQLGCPGEWPQLIANITTCFSTPPVCAAVQSLTATSDCTTNNVNLAWTNGEVYVSIEIERGGTLIATIPGASTSFTDLAVPGGTTYIYRVRGVCAAGPAFPISRLIQHCFTGPRMLYCPSESDDAAYRNAIMNVTGGLVDYFDARNASPDATLLADYDVVYTWANFAYFNNVEMGDNLANFVDAGGKVILGAFCTYTQGNSLAGNIMTDFYSPVTSPSGANHFNPSNYVGDGTECIHTTPIAITTYECFFRDFLTLQGLGLQDGSYADGEIAHAYRDDYAVMYSNGCGASQLGCSGQWAEVIGNAALCPIIIPLCPTVYAISCTADCAGLVTLNWTNNSVYTSIIIRRNGTTIATLPGASTSFNDTPPGPGSYIYTIAPICAAGPGTERNCTAGVSGPGIVFIWAAESAAQIDSVGALAQALDTAGIEFIEVSTLNAVACMDSSNVLFCMLGTFPSNHQLSIAEGQILKDRIQAGVAVYVEGGDTWGFDAPSPFDDVDGIDESSSQDGDDSLLSLIGSDYAGALFGGMLDFYNEDQFGFEFTDQLALSSFDMAGPNSGVTWQNNPLGYNVGVFYDTDAPNGKVMCQSWEFGGWGGDQDDLLDRILAALNYGGPGPGGEFRRADTNSDLVFNIADAVFLLSALFVPGSPAAACQDSADVNDDGVVNIADAVFALSALFVPGSPSPPAPFPACGSDGTADTLTCVTPNCP